jgi:hypothetical protein
MTGQAHQGCRVQFPINEETEGCGGNCVCLDLLPRSSSLYEIFYSALIRRWYRLFIPLAEIVKRPVHIKGESVHFVAEHTTVSFFDHVGYNATVTSLALGTGRRHPFPDRIPEK